jgi:tetratricopeptide (TPR) repeat protein
VSNPAAMLLTQGTQLNNIGRYDAALSVLSKAIVATPQAVEPHCEMAYSLLKLRRDQEALREAEVAASLDPQYERPHRLRSIILNQLGRSNDALVAAETAVRLAPELPSGLYTLGSAQLRVKRVADAERTAENLLRIAPDWALSHLLRGQVALKRKQWKTAEDANRRALQIDPTNNTALNNLGVALQGQRRWKEALEIYQQAAQLDPNDDVAKANIVRMVRPVSGLGLVWDFVRMVLVPWAIPIVLIQLMIRFIRSARRRAQLRPGARIYYDREWAGARWHLPRVFLAALVFILGYAALAIAQLRGWTFVGTGIPTVVLLVICIGIAFSAVLQRLPAEIGRRWKRR